MDEGRWGGGVDPMPDLINHRDQWGLYADLDSFLSCCVAVEQVEQQPEQPSEAMEVEDPQVSHIHT
jgi:hypothetical protein